jgi:hypothetical protein
MSEGSDGMMPAVEPVPRGGALIRFSPNIELGHILQAIVILMSVGGWAIVGYFTIERQINEVTALVNKQSDRQDGEVAVMRQRLVVAEAAIGELREGMKASTSEMRQGFSTISDKLADLRTLVASQGRPGDARRP